MASHETRPDEPAVYMTMADILRAVRAERDRVDELVPMTEEDLRGQRYTIEQLNVAVRALTEARSMHSYFVEKPGD